MNEWESLSDTVYLLNAHCISLQEEVSKLVVLLRHIARASIPASQTRRVSKVTLLTTDQLCSDAGAAVDSPLEQSGDDAQRPLLTLPPRQLRTVVLINLQRLLTHTHRHTITDIRFTPNMITDSYTNTTQCMIIIIFIIIIVDHHVPCLDSCYCSLKCQLSFMYLFYH